MDRHSSGLYRPRVAHQAPPGSSILEVSLHPTSAHVSLHARKGRCSMSHRFSRREFLAAGATIAGGTALGVTACAPDTSVAPISPPTKPTTSVAPDGELL